VPKKIKNKNLSFKATNICQVLPNFTLSYNAIYRDNCQRMCKNRPRRAALIASYSKIPEMDQSFMILFCDKVKLWKPK
jgi:hypothetical protein